ncbi:hypothetical protein DSO57_1031658 [Entomophthora muscae]|uniref:Uncharacterized protein n=1 Tax=Entomophthora muscae TaxID=34485 RepID=A0ACC2TMZ1_9FUNG|nr:hypothetical protein DSO57_1031658 [Entomophthora muscae]
MVKNIILYNDPDLPGWLSDDQLTILLPKGCSDEAFLIHPTDSAGLASFIVQALEEDVKWLLLTFHAQYFPVQVWKLILEFFKKGHHFMGLGGVPFSRPLAMRGDHLSSGPYFHFLEELAIPLVHEIDVSLLVGSSPNVYSLLPDNDVMFLKEMKLFLANNEDIGEHRFYGFDPKLSDLDEIQGESGSSGTLDRVLTPLVHLRSTHKRLACAAWMMDHADGKFMGGRWVVVAWKPPSALHWINNADVIRQLILVATQSVPWLMIRPSLACYHDVERPSLIVSIRTNHPVLFEIKGETLKVSPCSKLQDFEVFLKGSYSPGLHKVDVQYSVGSDIKMKYSTGFWVWDETLIAERKCAALQASGRRFTVNGNPTLIFGTTYMDSRIQRHFLELPNPSRWDADMAEMASAGVNLIRTGLWWGWDYAGGREWFRALDGFLLTCLHNRLQVQFTFFTFTPHAFNGDHPWQDPRALQGQSDLLAAVARRYSDMAPLSFDLINEPSYGDPAKIFSARPIPSATRDADAFRKWQMTRTGGKLSLLNARWRSTLTSWEEVQPPSLDDLAINPNTTAAYNGFKALDFTLFSYDAFGTWVRNMKGSIRDAGSSGLVGVGQDEGRVRLPAQFHDEAEFTSTHPWWMLDDLLWDLVMDGVANVPHLAQEVGVMLTRDDSRVPFRSQTGAAFLLERKLYFALAAGCAGVVQWLWHTNGYMTLDNENSIGLVRVDGSAKPELMSFIGVGKFVKALQGFLPRKDLGPGFVAIAPYSQWALRTVLGEIPTKNLIRALSYHPTLRIVPQMVNEHHALKFTRTLLPKVVLLPSLHHLHIGAWEAIDVWVSRGTHLLVTGVVGLDEYGIPYPSMTEVLASLLETLPLLASCDLPLDSRTPVARYEVVERPFSFGVNFSNLAINYVYKQHNNIVVIKPKHPGWGSVAWCGLPLEMADSFIPMGSKCTSLGDFYAWALDVLSIRFSHDILVQIESPQGMESSLLVQQVKTSPNATAVILVSELGSDFLLKVRLRSVPRAEVHVRLCAQRSGGMVWDLSPDKAQQGVPKVSLFGGLELCCP